MDLDAGAADFFAALNSGESAELDFHIPEPAVAVGTSGFASAANVDDDDVPLVVGAMHISLTSLSGEMW